MLVVALTLECQHGFVYGRLMVDNIFKFLDALDLADELDLDAAAYLCDRDKAFDRVDHRWLIRLLCLYCGVELPLYETLVQYFHDPRVPDAVRWVIVILTGHVRKALVNGALTPAWHLFSSVFQGCVLAPTLYALAAEPEAWRQYADQRVQGLPMPDGSTCLSTRLADDTQNTVTRDSLHATLDNNTLWCLATAGNGQYHGRRRQHDAAGHREAHALRHVEA